MKSALRFNPVDAMWVLLGTVIVSAGGCSGAARIQAPDLARAAPVGAAEAPQTAQLLIEQVWLVLETDDVAAAAHRVQALAADFGGRVESNVTTGDRADLVLRVPAARSQEATQAAEGIARVKRKQTDTRDVTEETVDLEARLQTWTALRDRLREHLARAESIDDILAVERELGRVQADIDALQARLDHLRGEIDYSRIEVSIEKRIVLGPLGWVAVGLSRAIGSLFVWR